MACEFVSISDPMRRVIHFTPTHVGMTWPSSCTGRVHWMLPVMSDPWGQSSVNIDRRTYLYGEGTESPRGDQSCMQLDLWIPPLFLCFAPKNFCCAQPAPALLISFLVYWLTTVCLRIGNKQQKNGWYFHLCLNNRLEFFRCLLILRLQSHGK